MRVTLDGSPLDGSAYLTVVDLARRAPGWLDGAVSVWSSSGLVVFALLMAGAWWRARRVGATAAMLALAAPLVVLAAYGCDEVLKLAVREDRPCRSLRVMTLEACAAPGDWSFPSNHAAISAAAAVALLWVSRRIAAVAALAAATMAASRVWVGAHYPHDVVAGLLVGALIAAAAITALRRRPEALVRRITAAAWLRPLLSAS
ncbi:phosphatase PAP2 family protein [Streptomyces odontomachi]|uniref:phosphatase PAP2 family protein n=1 Tax=Streptomyces odontomachi TaxID=2944940 RepID=UPI00210C9A21|nr:phosphatase PAP2 family protein [Streptomyces sp. ODS25]